MDQLLTTLEQWYGVEISTSGVNRGKVFSGELTNSSLEQVLKGICFTLNCTYEIEQKKINIYGKE